MSDLPDDDLQWHYELKPRDYARWKGKPRALGPGPTMVVYRIARAMRVKDKPRPDPAEPYITGRYQSDAAAGFGETGDDCLLHVNQAGSHIEGILVDISGRISTKNARLHRFRGNLAGDSFDLFQYGPGTDGKLSARGGKLIPGPSGLTMTYEFPFGGEYLLHFRMRTPRPTFLDGALETLIETTDPKAPERGKHLIALAEHYPLSTVQMGRLREAVASEKIEQLLQPYFAVGGSQQSWAEERHADAAERLDEAVAHALDSPNCLLEQVDLARDYIRTVLAVHRCSIGSAQKSQLQWIEDIVSTVHSGDTVHRPLPALSALTGITPRATGSGDAKAERPSFEYDLTIKLKHKGKAVVMPSLRLGGYSGTLTIRPIKSPAWAEAERKYKVYLAGAGVIAGKGGEADIDAHAKMVTNEEWTPSDFPGWIKLLDGAYWAAKKIHGERIGVGTRETSLILHGSEAHREVIIGLQGLKESRTEYGAEFDANFGRIFDFDHVFQEEDFTRPRERADYQVAVSKRDDNTHFEFGGSPVTTTGRSALRMFAAEWLPWLASPDAILVIVGHADTVDRASFNKELSALRALNVKQALRDILGERLAIPDDQIKYEGHGEDEACHTSGLSLCEGRKREHRDEKYRRVDVYLNGRLTVTFWSS